jgi:hypothetical protein
MQLVGANPGEPSACRVVGSLRNKASIMQSEAFNSRQGKRATDYKTWPGAQAQTQSILPQLFSAESEVQPIDAKSPT